MVSYAVLSAVLAVAVVVAFSVGVLVGRRRAEPDRVVWQEPAVARSSGAGGTATHDVASDPELRGHLAAGQLIAAIKRHRELTGAGLKESKDAVEAMQRAMGRGR